MKEKIERMRELDKEMQEIHREINKHVIEVAKRYIVAAHDENRGYGYPTQRNKGRNNTFYDWEVDDDSIGVTWEETWNYGGHDGGAFSVPENFFWDESALVAFEEKRAREKADKKAEKEAKERQKEIEQMKKLQEKYPDEKD